MKNKNYSLKPIAAMAMLLSVTMGTKADIITDWNLITVKATKIAKQNSNYATRTEAVEAIAVYDAVNAIKQFGTAYHYKVHAKSSASAIAAAAQAAHDVLVTYFPDQKGSLDSALANSLATAKDGDIKAGQTVGSAAAADILALRVNDGANPDSSYANPANAGIGQYRLTPGKFVPGADVQWGKVTPFLLTSGNQFLPAAPPAIGSDEYKNALAEVAAIGSINSTTRTEEQTHIAQFYKQDAELTVNEGARVLAIAHPKSIAQTALIFALVDIAEADARIEVWGGKYLYLFWRPVTALNADADGTVTNNYTKWTPLINTPAHPSFPSGHSATVAAGYDILKAFYGDDNVIELHTTTAGEPARSITSLSKIEWENGYSRVYGGIHYIFENNEAQNIGHKIAAFVIATGPRASKAVAAK
jgi:hypothetical protein